MAAESLPWMPWFPSDFLSSSKVQRMTLAEQGAYRRLLDYQWMDGSIPSDIKDIARLLGVGKAEAAALWRRVGKCFEPRGDTLLNARLDVHRVKAIAKHLERSETGRRGAKAKWSANGSANGSANAQPMASTTTTTTTTRTKALSAAAPQAEPSPTRQFTDGWAALFAKHRDGAVYAFEGAKDGGHVKAILKHAAGDVVEALRRADLHLADPFWCERGANLGTLRSQWNRVIQGHGNGSANGTKDPLGGVREFVRRLQSEKP